jgi:hypothetical protein
VPVKALRDARHLGTVQEIAKKKFPFPGPDNPELETVVNYPKGMMAIAGPDGKDFFPDIVVVRRPGTWIKLIAQVETADSLTDETALERWAPCASFGDLLVYVPFGCRDEAKALLKQHHIKAKGIRLWRFRPVWGLDVSDA